MWFKYSSLRAPLQETELHPHNRPIHTPYYKHARTHNTHNTHKTTAHTHLITTSRHPSVKPRRPLLAYSLPVRRNTRTALPALRSTPTRPSGLSLLIIRPLDPDPDRVSTRRTRPWDQTGARISCTASKCARRAVTQTEPCATTRHVCLPLPATREMRCGCKAERLVCVCVCVCVWR
jgi:hypothetical protein